MSEKKFNQYVSQKEKITNTDKIKKKPLEIVEKQEQ